MVEFRKNAKQRTIDSCKKTADIKNKERLNTACKCYADAYIDQYSDEALISMIEWMAENPEKTSIVVYMLDPERRACNIP